MESVIQALFARYERFFNQSLAGQPDSGEMAALYASEFIAASPLGIMAGKNDERFGETMVQGYEHYRQIGTREMRISHVRLSPIDALHCVAHVAWTATYARDDLPETSIDFEVHYLVQVREGEAKVFGWVSGDEEALLKERGIV